ncbi:MAG: hypothetical protein Q6370_018850 [Candidatus Sigynarchaeota archaeon]
MVPWTRRGVLNLAGPRGRRRWPAARPFSSPARHVKTLRLMVKHFRSGRGGAAGRGDVAPRRRHERQEVVNDRRS